MLEERFAIKPSVEAYRRVVAELATQVRDVHDDEAIKQLTDWINEARESEGKHDVLLQVGRDGVFVQTRPCWEEASCGTLSVYDRNRKRIGTIYLGQMPESEQPTMTRRLTEVITGVLKEIGDEVPTMRYVTDAGCHPQAYYRDVLSKMKHPVSGRRLSPPGCGKSQFCKALGHEVGRPVVMLDVGSLMGSLVGQSEERTRNALRTIDAMAPCVAMLDEVDKAFAGIGGSGQNDSGVSARMFGTFLSWLNDHESDVFVVCTANDVTKLPPEFSRSERFDGVFFLDLPGREQKDAIWQMYIQLYELDVDQSRPNDDQWTGAEIKSCCRLAALLDLPLVEAGRNIVPVAVTSAESVGRLREWASGRCLDADVGGTYRHQLNGKATRRKITRGEPSSN